MPRPARVLRASAFTLLALLLALATLVQIQQRLFRHRAERLHAEILQLQLHPGTFADLQRLQTEWGAHAQYNGECTARHCIYQIAIHDWVTDHLLDKPYAGNTLILLDNMFGGHPASVTADIRVHENRVWGADFALLLWNALGERRNHGQPYELIVFVGSSPRLVPLENDEADLNSLREGFETSLIDNCLGCEAVSAQVNAQTGDANILRFNQIRFDCLTSLYPCRHPEDLAPALTSQALQDRSVPPRTYDSGCDLPSPTLAREANDIVLARVLQVTQLPNDDSTGLHGFNVTAHVLEAIKNGTRNRTSPTLTFLTVAQSSNATVGASYFFLYRQPLPNEIVEIPYVRACQIIPATDASRAQVTIGISWDPSTGERYDFPNEPGFTFLR